MIMTEEQKHGNRNVSIQKIDVIYGGANVKFVTNLNNQFVAST